MNRFVTILLFTVLLFTMYLVVNSKIAGGHASIFGYQIKTVLSGSMEPDIQTGSIIFVKTGGDMTRFKEGDVITYLMEENVLVTHRVEKVESNGQLYVTKGDANDRADFEPVLADNVVGEYTGTTIPKVGYVMNFANSKEGAVLLLIIPGALLVLYAFITIWRAARELDQTKHRDGSRVS
ncbi:signal peptidase I SipW [Virgibacillus soli]